MPVMQTDTLLLVRSIRKNIETLERSIASANHTIVQSKAMLVRLENARTRTEAVSGSERAAANCRSIQPR
jgi:hypothetical protein